MDDQQVTEFELGWLVGIFDGEGCYTIAKTIRHGDTSLTPGIKFVNTNEEIIEEVCWLLKRLKISHYVYNSWRSVNQKAGKRIEINGLKRIKRFFDVLFPRLKCRKIQAGLLKEFVELRLSVSEKTPYGIDEFSIYNALRNENKRGPGTSETTRELP